MTQEDLYQAVEAMHKRHEEIRQNLNRELNQLSVEYARKNNPYKIGDIVSDHTNTIKIEKIEYVRTHPFHNGVERYLAECCYSGVMITKDGNPRKDGRVTNVYQSRVKQKEM